MRLIERLESGETVDAYDVLTEIRDDIILLRNSALIDEEVMSNDPMIVIVLSETIRYLSFLLDRVNK